jgi:hypothetical protein
VKCSVECLERADCPTDKPVCSSSGECVVPPVQKLQCRDVKITGIFFTIKYIYMGNEASSAIDGDPGTSVYTDGGAGNWWRMDFDSSFKGYTITTVNVNRGKSSLRDNVKVQLLGSTGNSLLAKKPVADNTWADNINPQTFTFNVSGVHAVKIVQPSNTYLHTYLQLAEVEVQGTPPL